jgi:hypothetical protein
MLTENDVDRIVDKAIMFHYRNAEREGWVAWQPARAMTDADLDVNVVVLAAGDGDSHLALYSFHETASGALRFRALEPEVKGFKATCNLIADAKGGKPELRAKRLTTLGLSTREIGRLLGVSHESARAWL